MKMESIEMISNRHSGYGSNAGHWEGFLKCWMGEKRGGFTSMLNAEFIRKDESVAELILEKERELGLNLPQSYKDFLRAYRPARSSFDSQEPGFLPVEDIGRALDVHPEYAAELAKHAIESDDQEYFRYGVGQDSSSGRTKNFNDSIVLGRYSDDWYGIIVLYPQNKTLDGEMEAAAFFHSGEFRAPSFAELMRQLYLFEARDYDSAPPYPQDSFKNTCAGLILLRNVWWK